MKIETIESIREDIFESITELFGFTITGFTQIELGFRNLKWKIETDHGVFFAKQYNKIRYPEHMVQGLETALNYQAHLYNVGIPCPKLITPNGNYVIRTAHGERYVLMEFCEGRIIQSGTANEDQMYSLGKIVGQMHCILNSNSRTQLPLHWDVRTKESMLKNWQSRWNEAVRLDSKHTLANLEIQRNIIEKCDPYIFSQCEKGWAHWDLFVDNILFQADRVSTILDFDRMHYVYLEFDISRPILSCCLENGHIHLDRVSAFVRGYQEHLELTHEKLVRSIKLTWWKEAEWVRAEYTNLTSPLKRFVEENVWVGENWDHLDELFSKLL